MFEILVKHIYGSLTSGLSCQSVHAQDCDPIPSSFTQSSSWVAMPPCALSLSQLLITIFGSWDTEGPEPPESVNSPNDETRPNLYLDYKADEF